MNLKNQNNFLTEREVDLKLEKFITLYPKIKLVMKKTELNVVNFKLEIEKSLRKNINWDTLTLYELDLILNLYKIELKNKKIDDEDENVKKEPQMSM